MFTFVVVAAALFGFTFLLTSEYPTHLSHASLGHSMYSSR
jgi:hypothetical protein